MQIDVHVHLHQASNEEKLDRILANQEKMMAKVDDLKAELVAANEVTNEIASDIDDLVKRVGEGSLSPAEADEVKTQLSALTARLKGVAAVHTPGSVA